MRGKMQFIGKKVFQKVSSGKIGKLKNYQLKIHYKNNMQEKTTAKFMESGKSR